MGREGAQNEGMSSVQVETEVPCGIRVGMHLPSTALSEQGNDFCAKGHGQTEGTGSQSSVRRLSEEESSSD